MQHIRVIEAVKKRAEFLKGAGCINRECKLGHVDLLGGRPPDAARSTSHGCGGCDLDGRLTETGLFGGRIQEGKVNGFRVVDVGRKRF